MSRAQEVLNEDKHMKCTNCQIASHEWEINYRIEAVRLMGTCVSVSAVEFNCYIIQTLRSSYSKD